MRTVKVCGVCGVAFGVDDVAVLVNGRLTLELALCAPHRDELVQSLGARRQ